MFFFFNNLSPKSADEFEQKCIGCCSTLESRDSNPSGKSYFDGFNFKFTLRFVTYSSSKTSKYYNLHAIQAKPRSVPFALLLYIIHMNYDVTRVPNISHLRWRFALFFLGSRTFPRENAGKGVLVINVPGVQGWKQTNICFSGWVKCGGGGAILKFRFHSMQRKFSWR